MKNVIAIILIALGIFLFVQGLNRKDSLAGEPGAIVRRGEIEDRSERNDPRGIYLLMRHVIMPLDVIEVNRVRDSRLLIEIAEIPVQIRIIENAAEIAFEMPEINRVETHQ